MTENEHKISRRTILAGILAATGTGWLGKEVIYPNIMQIIQNGKDRVPSLSTSLDNKELPETLPPAVAAMQNAVVSINAYDYPNYDNVLSGVILDNYHILTAGHGFRTASGTFLPFVGCLDDIVISGRDAKGNVINTNSTKIVSSFQSDDYSIPDVALIKTQTPMGDPNTISPIVLRDSALRKGDPVFFINYETTSPLNYRNPYSTQAGLQFPAIYGGLAFAKWKGDIVARVGEKNYGKGVPDTKIHGGASGGGVFDEKGYFLGLSNRSAYDGDEALIQPITHSLLASLYNRLEYKPDACKS